MSKHRGSNFKDYLKERGISEEVSALAEKRWEILRTEVSLAPEDTTEETLDDSPNHIHKFFHRFRRRINDLLSALRLTPPKKSHKHKF